jgi:hypothetical protein
MPVAHPKLWWQGHLQAELYAHYLGNAVPSQRKVVRMCHFWEFAVKRLWHRLAHTCCGTVMCSSTVDFEANEVVRCGKP